MGRGINCGAPPTRCGIDLDGVVYQWEPRARALIADRFDIVLPESTYYDSIRDAIPKDAWEWLWTTGVSTWGLFRDGDAYPGACEALKKLHRDGHDVVIVTARPRSARAHTMEWLGRMKIPASEVHVLDQGVPKSSIPCDWYVDDSASVVEELAAAFQDVFVWDRPWNRGLEVGLRVRSWDELPHL